MRRINTAIHKGKGKRHLLLVSHCFARRVTDPPQDIHTYTHYRNKRSGLDKVRKNFVYSVKPRPVRRINVVIHQEKGKTTFIRRADSRFSLNSPIWENTRNSILVMASQCR